MPAVSATILVVDRRSPATEALIAFLRGRGMRVLWSAGGDDATRALNGSRVDALVAPLGTPGIDGLALGRASL